MLTTRDRSYPHFVLAAALEGLLARHTRIEDHITALRRAMRSAHKAQPLWSAEMRRRQSEGMRRYWARRRKQQGRTQR